MFVDSWIIREATSAVDEKERGATFGWILTVAISDVATAGGDTAASASAEASSAGAVEPPLLLQYDLPPPRVNRPARRTE